MAGNSADSGRSVTSKVTAILMTFTGGSVHSLTEIARCRVALRGGCSGEGLGEVARSD